MLFVGYRCLLWYNVIFYLIWLNKLFVIFIIWYDVKDNKYVSDNVM